MSLSQFVCSSVSVIVKGRMALTAAWLRPALSNLANLRALVQLSTDDVIRCRDCICVYIYVFASNALMVWWIGTTQYLVRNKTAFHVFKMKTHFFLETLTKTSLIFNLEMFLS